MPDYVTIARWALTNYPLWPPAQIKIRCMETQYSFHEKKKVASLYLLFCLSQKAISL